MFKKNSEFTPYAPVIIAGAIIVGLLMGRFMFTQSSGTSKALAGKKISSLLQIIENNYVDKVAVDSLIESSIPLILSNLDPHSVYIPLSELQATQEPLQGSFDGIGVQFNMQNDTALIISVIRGGPSEKVGLLPGDRIVKINDSVYVGKKIKSDDIIKHLKGKKGTKVTISIARRGTKNLLNFEIERGKIPIYSVDVAYMVTSEIGYVKISRFAQTTHDEFVKAIDTLKLRGMKKLIVDLRGNSGGFLNEATEIADEFLPTDKLIVYTKGQARARTDYYATDNDLCLNEPVSILVDTWSASASEILAGAIQDNDRGLIIGRRTFGKGLVQEPVYFHDGSLVRLTIARYYTPTGRSIQKPYSHNTDDYSHEIMGRMKNGEFTSDKNIHFNDSLKFTTPKGKVVYGGGGIMPDIFVPVDTIGNSDFFDKISEAGLIYRFSLEYADKNRKALVKLRSETDIIRYLNAQQIVNQFISFAAENNMVPNGTDLQVSGKLIENQLHALIARNVFDNEYFYKIIQKWDNVLLKAISEMEAK